MTNPFETKKSKQNLIPIDDTTISLCHEKYFSSNWARLALSQILTEVFNKDITLLQDNKILKDDKIQALIERWWIPCGKKVLVELNISGVAPISFNKTDDGNIVPVFVEQRCTFAQKYDSSKDEYDIYCFRPDDTSSNLLTDINSIYRTFETDIPVAPSAFSVIWSTTDGKQKRPDPHIFVFTADPCRPSEKGIIRSPFSTVLSKIIEDEIYDEFDINQLNKEKDPFHFATSTQNNNGTGFSLNEATHAYSNTSNDAFEKKTNKMLQEAMAILKINEKIEEEYKRSKIGTVNNSLQSNIASILKLRNYHPPPKIWPVLPGFQISQVERPPVRTEYEKRKQFIQEEICTALGIPKSMLIAEGKIIAGVQQSQTIFNTTVKTWTNVLEQLFQILWSIIYQRPDAQQIVKKEKDNTDSKKQSKVKEEDNNSTVDQKERILKKDILNASKQTYDVQFKFLDKTKTLPLEEFVKAWQLDAITKEELDSSVRRYIGIPENDLSLFNSQKQTKDFSHKEKMLMFYNKWPLEQTPSSENHTESQSKKRKREDQANDEQKHKKEDEKKDKNKNEEKKEDTKKDKDKNEEKKEDSKKMENKKQKKDS